MYCFLRNAAIYIEMTKEGLSAAGSMLAKEKGDGGMNRHSHK